MLYHTKKSSTEIVCVVVYANLYSEKSQPFISGYVKNQRCIPKCSGLYIWMQMMVISSEDKMGLRRQFEGGGQGNSAYI